MQYYFLLLEERFLKCVCADIYLFLNVGRLCKLIKIVVRDKRNSLQFWVHKHIPKRRWNIKLYKILDGSLLRSLDIPFPCWWTFHSLVPWHVPLSWILKNTVNNIPTLVAFTCTPTSGVIPSDHLNGFIWYGGDCVSWIGFLQLGNSVILQLWESLWSWIFINLLFL